MGHANLQKRCSASSWLLQSSKIFYFLKALWTLLPTAEVQHGKGNVSIQTSKTLIFKKIYPKGKYWGFTYKCFYCSDNDWVTARATQKHDEVRKEIPHLLLKEMTLVPCDSVQLPPSPSSVPAPCCFKHKQQQKHEGSGQFQQFTPYQTQKLVRCLFQSPCSSSQGGKSL